MDMSKYGSLSNVLNCTWSNAVIGFWIKYPNQHSQHVLTEDILERKICPDGKLYTRRILSKTNPLPKWGSFVFGSHLKKMVHIVEESFVDPAKKIMTVYTWNTSYTDMMDVQEKITITSNEDTKTTGLFKEGWINSSLKGCRRLLRTFGYNRWQSNARKAFFGYQAVISGDAQSQHNVIGEKTMQSINNVKDKAKLKAINLAKIANTGGI